MSNSHYSRDDTGASTLKVNSKAERPVRGKFRAMKPVPVKSKASNKENHIQRCYETVKFRRPKHVVATPQWPESPAISPSKKETVVLSNLDYLKIDRAVVAP